jgi:hypothetical protein
VDRPHRAFVYGLVRGHCGRSDVAVRKQLQVAPQPQQSTLDEQSVQVVRKALREWAKSSDCRSMIASHNTFDSLPKMILGDIKTIA